MIITRRNEIKTILCTVKLLWIFTSTCFRRSGTSQDRARLQFRTRSFWRGWSRASCWWWNTRVNNIDIARGRETNEKVLSPYFLSSVFRPSNETINGRPVARPEKSFSGVNKTARVAFQFAGVNLSSCANFIRVPKIPRMRKDTEKLKRETRQSYPLPSARVRARC